MKTIIILVCLLTFSWGQAHDVETSASNEKKSEKTIALYLSPAALILGGVGVGGEFAINENASIGLEGMSVNTNTFLGISGITFKGTQGSVRYNYFLKGVLQDSIYYLGGIRTGSFDISYESTTDGILKSGISSTSLMVGAGRNWAWDNSFFMRLAAVGSLQAPAKVEFKNAAGAVVNSSNVSALGIGFDFFVGWAF